MEMKIAVFCTWPVEFSHRLSINAALYGANCGLSVDVIDVSEIAMPLYSFLNGKNYPLPSFFVSLLRKTIKRNSFYIRRGLILDSKDNDLDRIFIKPWKFKFSKRRINLPNRSKNHDRYLELLILDAKGLYPHDIPISKIKRGIRKLNKIQSKVFKVISRIDDYDQWWIFNGRFPVDMILKNYAIDNGITTKFFEIGFRENSFCVYDDSPHSLIEHRKNALYFWSESNIVEREQVAIRYLENRINHCDLKSGFWNVNQSKGTVRNLPLKKIVTFFLSTEGELASSKNEIVDCLFVNQIESIKWIMNNLDFDDWHLVIRGHPNRSSIRSKDLVLRHLPIIEENQLNFTYISEDASDDSIELIKKSDLVCIYDSSIGIDAIYLNKPLLILGKPLFTALLENPIKAIDEISFKNLDKFSYDKEYLKIWAWYSNQYGIELYF